MSTCRVTPGCENPIENQDTGACASCGAALRKATRIAKKIIKKSTQQFKRTPIKKVSAKMASELQAYFKQKRRWIKGKFCVVYPDQPATTVHHMKGREGYADQWARDHGVTLLRDERFWLPASLDGHRYIEDRRAWAEEKGFTLSRSEKTLYANNEKETSGESSES